MDRNNNKINRVHLAQFLTILAHPVQPVQLVQRILLLNELSVFESEDKRKS